jgi:hypothetical protein
MEYFSNFNSKDAQSVTFEQLADLIRSDEQLKKSTLLYRDLLAQGHDKAANDVKKATPQVAVSFRMEGGKGKDNCRECHYQMLIDFDAKSPKERLPNDELERVKTFLRTSYHARFGYESISGLGYHIVVPFILPDGITIDMTDDPKLAEEIYTRVYRRIANQFTVWCGHPMDKECKNINRLMGLCHDPLAVYRPDARPFRLTREELGIDADGKLETLPHGTQQQRGARGESPARLRALAGRMDSRDARLHRSGGGDGTHGYRCRAGALAEMLPQVVRGDGGGMAR